MAKAFSLKKPITIKNSGIYLLIAGLICAAIAAWGAVKFLYISTGSVPVVKTVREIQPYTKITKEDLQIESMPRAAVKDGMFASPNAVIGRYTRTLIPAGWAVSETALAPTNVTTGLAAHLTELKNGRLRAKSIPVDRLHGVNGQIKASDRVDVIGSMKLPYQGQQQPVAQIIGKNILVLDTVGKGDSMSGVILALTPQQCQDIDFAMINGTISLTLNGFETDENAANTTPTTADNFVARYLAPGQLPEINNAVPEETVNQVNP